MKYRVFLFLSVVTALVLGHAPAQAIQLRSGEVLVGEVVDATSEGLTFRRLDTGGFLELGWDDLSTLHAERIKRFKGLVVEEDEEPTIEADVLVYTPGGAAREEVVGLIDWEASTSTHVVLKRKNDLLPVRRESIKKKFKREVPVLEVYTADEYYELKKAEIDPGEDADKHILLAEQMRLVGQYERAETHLLEAERLGGGNQASQIPIMLQRVRNLREAAAERDLLAQIRYMRNREEFERAEELMARFKEEYPDSNLMIELEREKERFDEALADYAVERLRQAWDATVRRVANDKVAERGITFAQARAYAEDQMADDVFERLAKTLEMTPEELEQYWAKRNEHGRGRAIIYSYGVGSWVLGEDKVIAGTKAEGGGGANKAGGDSPEDRELERIIRKLREYRDQRRRGGAGGQGERETEEDWWRLASRNERTGWLRAYFAEFGGYMEITNAYAEPCPNCAGQGFQLELGDTGREQKAECPVCHGTKYSRLFRAR